MMTGHGGNIYRFAEEFRIHEKRIIDFSSSINPLGVSKRVCRELQRCLKNLPNYPDPDARRLKHHLSIYHDIPHESILCGNGSTELIYLVARALRPERVLIPAPTFSEYERAVILTQHGVTGSPIQYFRLNEDNHFDIIPDQFIQALEGCDMVFLCNPNNPTGRLLKRGEVIKIADAARNLECYLVVDEAFIDFCPEDSVIREVSKNPYLIILRSVTKFYALAGLRLGYGVFPSNLVRIIEDYREPWTVNTLAQRAGVVAINDIPYRDETLRTIKEEKEFLEGEFKSSGIDYIPSAVNYYLIRFDNATEVIMSLKNRGILVRDCSDFRGLDKSYIRIAVKSHRHNVLLLSELKRLISNGDH